jgi:hypothetical protein
LHITGVGYLQQLLFNMDKNFFKYNQICHAKYWFHCRDFQETQNRSINYCWTDLCPTLAKLVKELGMQKMGGNPFMLLHIVLLPLRQYSWNCKFQAYYHVHIPYQIVGKSTKNVGPGGQKKHSCPDMKHCIHFTEIHKIHYRLINYCGDVPYRILAK